MNEKYKALRVKEPTHKKTKVAAANAGMTVDDYIKYILLLGMAYPPTIDYKKVKDV